MNTRNHLFVVLKSLMNVRLKPGTGNIIPSKVTPFAFLTLIFAIILLLWGLFCSPATAVNPESIADEETAPDMENFDRAGENAWLVGMFSRFLGLNGFSAFANYAEGTTPDSGVQASPDQRELDFTADYRVSKRFLESLWFRFRTAFVRKDGPHSLDVDEYQLIMNFDIPVL